jgi:hypothetical protein
MLLDAIASCSDLKLPQSYGALSEIPSTIPKTRYNQITISRKQIRFRNIYLACISPISPIAPGKTSLSAYTRTSPKREACSSLLEEVASSGDTTRHRRRSSCILTQSQIRSSLGSPAVVLFGGPSCTCGSRLGLGGHYRLSRGTVGTRRSS